MHPLKLVTVISCYLVICSCGQRSTQAFWLTDGSLFQQPSSKQVVVVDEASAGPDLVRLATLGTNSAAQQQQEPSAPIASADLNASKKVRLVGGQSEGATGGGGIARVANNDTRTLEDGTLEASGGAIVTNRIEPWIRLADMSSDTNNNDAQAIQTTARSQVSSLPLKAPMEFPAKVLVQNLQTI